MRRGPAPRRAEAGGRRDLGRRRARTPGVLVPAPPPPSPTAATVRVLGRSVGGRPIRLVELGRRDAPRVVLVVGCVHGDECAGRAVVARLERLQPRPGVRLLLLSQLNPDGAARHARRNGRGVDLNRNFPSAWTARGDRRDLQYPGPRPFSEPESRLLGRLVRRERPALTIWYHQPQALVRAWGASRGIARRYSALAGARYRALPWPAGTAPRWQNRALGLRSFVVELPPGRLPAVAVTRHALAVLGVARWA